MDGQKTVNDRPKAFKDYFDRSAAKALAAQVHSAHSSFDKAAFVRRAVRKLDGLSFAERVQQFSDALRAGLPDAVPKALAILTASLPEPLPDCENVTDGWLQWPVGQFIADHGLPHFDESMTAMVELTQRFSSEFAVRPFVEHEPEETFARLLTLTEHSNPHVRRWCSEGVRPRLPWGKKLKALVADPRPIWPILEALKDDDERYVQRSVANNLNDIAKDHPDAVVARCRTWARAKQGARRRWVVNHALRTLIKDGHPGALTVVGYGPPDRLKASLDVHPAQIKIGERVELTAELRSTSSKAQSLVVDYAVHFVRLGDKTSSKVFKWTQTEMAARGKVTLEKGHPMRPTSVRALYPGRHRVVLQVNGQALAEASFELR